MYKRTKLALEQSTPPNQTCMFYAQYGKAIYSSDIAFTITARIDGSGAYGLIEYIDKYGNKI